MNNKFLEKAKEAEEAYQKLMQNPIQTWNTGWTVFIDGEWKLLSDEYDKRVLPLVMIRDTFRNIPL